MVKKLDKRETVLPQRSPLNGRQPSKELTELWASKIEKRVNNKIEKTYLRKSLEISDIKFQQTTYRPKLDTIPNVNEKFEKKKYQVIKSLDKKLQSPFIERKNQTTRN